MGAFMKISSHIFNLYRSYEDQGSIVAEDIEEVKLSEDPKLASLILDAEKEMQEKLTFMFGFSKFTESFFCVRDMMIEMHQMLQLLTTEGEK
jgi:hypothetical protein